jgi:hypothetical protein
MKETMTIREIAELTGKSMRSVVIWIRSCAETAQDNAQKPPVRERLETAQKTKKPAEFTLEETIAIIRAGGNELLANLLAQNASATCPPSTEGGRRALGADASEGETEDIRHAIAPVGDAVIDRAVGKLVDKALPVLAELLRPIYRNAICMGIDEATDRIDMSMLKIDKAIEKLDHGLTLIGDLAAVQRETKRKLERVTGAQGGCFTLGDAAQALGMEKPELLNYLRGQRILRVDMTPAVKWVERDYLRWTFVEFDGVETDQPVHRTYVTPAGMDFIRKLMGR